MAKRSPRFSRTHEWVLANGATGTVGITDYAQESLGDIVYVSLPSVGTVLMRDGALGEIESVKAVSELFSPVSGEVVEVNTRVFNSPGVVNADPYGEGWLVKIRLSNAAELKRLLGAAAYKKLIG